MAELLKLALRGEVCPAEAQVGADSVGLVCDLNPGHPGPLHYDRIDRIWWFADA
jgi:hypothetical protein